MPVFVISADLLSFSNWWSTSNKPSSWEKPHPHIDRPIQHHCLFPVGPCPYWYCKSIPSSKNSLYLVEVGIAKGYSGTILGWPCCNRCVRVAGLLFHNDLFSYQFNEPAISSCRRESNGWRAWLVGISISLLVLTRSAAPLSRTGDWGCY